MKYPASYGQEPQWCAQRYLLRRRLPSRLQAWLFDETSLTRRLRSACGGGFRVELLEQGWLRPLAGEARLLKLRRGERALIRQVYLLCDDRPWVFARTVVPRASLTGRRRRLARLGTRPLGALLFADPSMRRGEVQFACLGHGQPLFHPATKRLTPKPTAIWGRRSIFYLDAKPLLVNEIFLPGLAAGCAGDGME